MWDIWEHRYTLRRQWGERWRLALHSTVGAEPVLGVGMRGITFWASFHAGQRRGRWGTRICFPFGRTHLQWSSGVDSL